MATDARIERLREYFVDELSWGWGHQARAVFSFLLDAAEDCRGGAVLDAGAGHQRYRPFFDDECLYLTLEHPAGIDHKRMGAIDYDLLGELDGDIPLADGCLHGVVNTSVLEHLRHPERFLAEAHRILRPGGRLYTHVPFTYPEHEEPFDFQRPTSYALRSWLAEAGFVDVEIVPDSSNLTAAVSFVEDALRWDLGDTGHHGEHRRLSELTAPVLAELRRVGADLVGPGTRFPVGWLAVASVPGTLGPAEAGSRSDFLARYGRRAEPVGELCQPSTVDGFDGFTPTASTTSSSMWIRPDASADRTTSTRSRL